MAQSCSGSAVFLTAVGDSIFEQKRLAFAEIISDCATDG